MPMSADQATILAVLLATMAMFLFGRWRHDMVAVGALLACVLSGLVSYQDAFAGFGHPAVVTVACVLVLSAGLQHTGAVDALTRRVLPASAGAMTSIAALTALAAVLSGFMNNVGALALLMPVAVQIARRLDLPPGRVLMPLAFGSILGGMTTMVGTPPNLIVAGFRQASGAGSFGVFDFTPVGLAVAASGVAFIALLGWRLVPARRAAGVESFETGAYITEARVPEDGKAVGMTLGEIEALFDNDDAQLIGMVRNELRIHAPNPRRRVRAGDILMVEAEADALSAVLSAAGLELAEARKPDEDKDKDKEDGGRAKDKPADQEGGKDEADKDARPANGDEVALTELAVLPQSSLIQRSPRELQLRTRYSINLLALSRQGQRSVARLRHQRLMAGDVLLMQGHPDAVADFAAETGCVPLAQRPLRLPADGMAWRAAAIMVLSIGAAALGLLPAHIALAAGVLASMALRTVPLRAVYTSVDWPVVVLLAALLPVAGAMETTGAAELLSRLLLDHLAQGNAVLGLAVILITTMLLTDLMNNAATAAVMAPVAMGAATQLGVNPDTFLMGVAVGASCAFLTPIGHQNNTLILGPGGFRFSDYWRLGVPLDVLVVGVSMPMLLWVWPL